MLTIAQLQQQAWATAEAKGHHENLNQIGIREATLVRLALIHTEVSEAAQLAKREGIHSGMREAFGRELADVLIRTAELAHCLGIDLERCTLDVLANNTRRPYQYGTPWESEGTHAT